MSKVIKIKATDNIKDSIRQVIDELGGFSNFITKGETVLIKPNYNTADASPASTAPDFLAAAVELVWEAGAGRLIVGESSTFTIRNHSISTQKTLCKACVYNLEKSIQPPEIYIFDDHQWVTKQIPEGKYLKKVSVPKIMDEVDKIILLPNCKTHFIADFTGALKLIIGFMKPTERISLHMGHVSEKVAEMNTIYQPDLIIMDARKCFITGGPAKGEVREPGLVLASTSRLDIDVEEIKIIQSFEGNSLAGKNLGDLPQIHRARELNIDK
jgi:uncharacterized protein (DUF362 family)